MRIVRMALIIVFLLSLSLFGATELVGLIGMDRTMPKISSDREVLEIPCEYTEEQLLEGLTASDGTDGDLTSQIIPGSFSRFIDDGVCNISYVVFDSSDHPATLTRQVRFTDYHPPRFTLTEPLVFAEQEGNYAEAMERLSASDQLDGNLEDWITQTDTDVNYQRAGSYTMTVEVSSSMGGFLHGCSPDPCGEPGGSFGRDHTHFGDRLCTGWCPDRSGGVCEGSDGRPGRCDGCFGGVCLPGSRHGGTGDL